MGPVLFPDKSLERGESPRAIAAALAVVTGKPKRQIYQLAITRRPER